MNTVPTLILNNGVTMPALGFGVFQTPPEHTAEAVRTALKVGYRHIDTAASYENERAVGDAIRESGIDRDEIFLESKVWLSDYGYEETRHAFEKSAGKLGVDVIDLFILHQPSPATFAQTIEAYRALESLLDEGKVRAIGVSNFQPDHLTELMAATEVTPAVNQIELHPYFQERPVVAANRSAGILTQAWSPIGGITFYFGDEKQESTLDDLTLAEIADAHDKTPAQVMLRWHLQQGRSAIPKSVTPARIRENFDVLHFELTGDQLARIDALDTGVRSGPDPEGLNQETAHQDIPEA